MKRARCSLLRTVALLLLSSLGAAVSGSDAGGEKKERPSVHGFDRLHRGMTPEQVRQHVGSPKRIARQILYHRHVEQWVYDPPNAARLQFDCRRGQKPLLLWVSTLSTEKGERGRAAAPR
ncbi:MAG TPA: hypothetical protein VH643_01555 [Gemmataceae bacterium]